MNRKKLLDSFALLAYSLSFSDCFAVATARRENAIVFTGDPEFKKVEHLVEIEWLNK